MKKVMSKDVIEAAIKYNKGLVSSADIYSILYNFNRDHKCIMTYNMSDDSIELTDDNKITELFLVDTENHYRKVRTVWRAVEEPKTTTEDVVEAVEQFNDEMIDVCDLNDVKNQFDKQHDSNITFRYNEDGKVSNICLIIANGLIKRTIWEINGQDIEKRFKKYVLNHVKILPPIFKESRIIRVEKDLTIRVTYLLCGYWAYERIGFGDTPLNTIVLNTDGMTLTKPRLWKVCDFIKAAYGLDDTLSIVGNFIHYYNASRRNKLSAQIFKGELIITRHDKDDKKRVVYRGMINYGE